MSRAEAEFLVLFLRRKLKEGYIAPEEVKELEAIEKALGSKVVESVER